MLACAACMNECRYVTDKDLAFFQYHAEGSGEVQGAGAWEILMQREIPGVIKYICWRRMLPVCGSSDFDQGERNAARWEYSMKGHVSSCMCSMYASGTELWPCICCVWLGLGGSCF